MSYEQIKAANDTIITTDIKGKDYAEVQQRIKAFRMVYPEGTIETEMLSNMNGICIFKATVSTEGKLLATGTAYEKEDSTFINRTSYIENCETSAVGRALGMAGFGIDTAVASAEEVQNAILNQDKPKQNDSFEAAKESVLNRMSLNDEKKATEKQISILRDRYTGDNYKKLLFANGISRLEDLPMKKAAELIEKIMRKD